MTDVPSDAALVAANLEIENLKERLQVSDDWNIRLQNQIQELLRLPKNEVQAFRERMQNPDIAIPLLQCYDSSIAEKDEQLERLKKENVELNTKLQMLKSEQAEWSGAIKVAEDLAKHVQGRSEDDLKLARRTIDNLQKELNEARIELTRALDSENDMRRHEEDLKKQCSNLKAELDVLREAKVKLEESQKILQSRLDAKNSTEDDLHVQSDAQRIQLQLLKHDGEDKLQEVERIRAKMIQALRLATDNHNAHLRIVQEKHQSVVEELQAIHRTQELEMMKLRAQLARLDPSNPSNMQVNAAMNIKSTTELLDFQTRQAQEIELKRLYAELSALQVQRDEAVLRYEQLTLNLRRDHDVQLQESRRDRQILQRKVDEYRARCDKLEQQKIDSESQLQPLRDRLQAAQSENDRLRSENISLQQRREDAHRKLTEAEINLSEVKEESHNALQAERKRAEMQELRVQEILKDLQAAKDKAFADSQLAIRQRDAIQKQLYESSQNLSHLENEMGKEQRETRALKSQLERINEALRLHKDQIQTYDGRVLALQKEIDVMKQKERSHLLLIEQLKVENNRFARAQNRVLETYQCRGIY